jgi:hypothetical protein
MPHLNEETSIVLSGDWSSPEAQRLSDAWFSALAMEHKLPNEVRYMEGMSGRKYRYLINNLINSTPDARYLEVGTYLGSTACSAMWGNKMKVTCIDDWSQSFFLGKSAKDGFLQNTAACTTDDIDFNFIESDFRKVNTSAIGKYNIYMFDGPHEEQDQYDGVALYEQALDDVYTLIVDDWNGPGVRKGTIDALEKLGHTVLARIDIITRNDSVHPEIWGPGSDWHNGYFIAVVSKK